MTNGIISAIDGDEIKVTVLCQSACTQCSQHKICPIEVLKKTVVIKEKTPDNYHVGDKVTLELSSSKAMWCLGIAYGIPLVLLVSIVVMGSILEVSEIKIGILALCALIPYYLCLPFFNSRLKKYIQIKMAKKSVD